VYIAALLVEHAAWSKDEVDVHVATRWVSKSSGVGLGSLAISAPESGSAEWRRIDRILALVYYFFCFVFCFILGIVFLFCFFSF
jgi:hypothetical protein